MGTLLTEEIRSEIFRPLIEQIKYNETGYGKFRVFDYEASLGKTHNFCKAIVENYHTKSIDYLFGGKSDPFAVKPKVLIVIKTKKEGFGVANKINQFDEEMQNTFQKDRIGKEYDQFAIAVNGDCGVVKGKPFDKYDPGHIKALHRFPTVIITQAMYLQICKNKKMGQDLFGNREILIIDEEVDFVYDTFDSITVSKISSIEEDYFAISNSCKTLFKSMVDDIRNALAKNHTQLKRVKLDYDQKLLAVQKNQLEKAIYNAIDDKNLEKLKSRGKVVKESDNKDTVIKNVIDKISRIIKFYNDDNVLSYQNDLFRFDSNITPFTLKNNIWIDASARFNHLYELDNDTFIIGEMSERIIDHSNSIIYHDKITKSTTSGKESYVDLERDVLRQIRDTIKMDDKVLIIDNKNECILINKAIDEKEEFITLKEANEKFSKNNDEIDDEYDSEKLQIIDAVNFFAMRGKNRWSEYNKCYIIQQPQLMFPYYVFLYEYWSKERLTDAELYLGNYTDEISGFRTFGFHLQKEEVVNGRKNNLQYSEEEVARNKNLEHLRQTSQASSIYQGIKRIQRNDSPKAEIYLITTDEKIYEMVKGELKGVKSCTFYFNPEFKNPEKAMNSVSKRLKLWMVNTERNRITTYERLASECEATVDNVKKILRKKSNGIWRIIKEKNLYLLNGKKGIEYFIDAEVGTEIGIDKFEKEHNVKWENFIRNSDGEVLKKARDIKCRIGIISVNK